MRDTRLFQQRRAQQAVNTAVLILLDRLDSMREMGIQVARKAVLATALRRPRLPSSGLTAAGLEVLGVGIKTGLVRNLFPASAVIQRLEDLASLY